MDNIDLIKKKKHFIELKFIAGKHLTSVNNKDLTLLSQLKVKIRNKFYCKLFIVFKILICL